MSAETAQRLFSRFEQGDASTTRRYGGTGLGLAICRDIAGLMGGTVDVRSALGKGATFTVTLPLKRLRGVRKAPEESPRSPEPTHRPAQNILVADDNATNQLVLKTLLNQLGLEPVMVANGREAVEAWREGAWDLVLMDVQMPIMDGPTAVRLIRTEEIALGRPRTRIVALTANAMTHQVEEYMAAGMDEVLAKPIEVQQLFAVLAAPPARVDPEIREQAI